MHQTLQKEPHANCNQCNKWIHYSCFKLLAYHVKNIENLRLPHLKRKNSLIYAHFAKAPALTKNVN